MTELRHAIFVYEPDGDMGYGYIVGPFQSEAGAERKARALERAAARTGDRVEAIVLPVRPGAESSRLIVADML